MIAELRQWLRRAVRRHPLLERQARLFLLRQRAKRHAYPDWQPLVESAGAAWPAARAAATNGPRVLVATSVGAYIGGVTVESMIATALTLRGAAVDVLLCDGVLPACLQCEVGWYRRQESFVRDGPARDFCAYCHPPAARAYGALDLPLLAYSQFLVSADHEEAASLAARLSTAELSTYRDDDIAVGEHALAGTLRFFARATIDDEPNGHAVLARYFQAALLTTRALRRTLAAKHYDVAVFHHGIYVPQGLVGEVCRRAGVRVVNWNPAYRKQTFIFSHDDTYHHTLMNEPTDRWDGIQLDAAQDAALTDYLQSRRFGTQDWIWFHERPEEDRQKILAEVPLDPAKPCIGLLTNVMWDAQLHYPANAFANMLDWVLASIRHFAARPDVQLLVRVHPAEIRGTVPSRQLIVDEVRSAFPVLPPNIFIVGPESQVSTYSAMEMCDAVLIYGTKTGVELTSMGIPVVVAGEAWIRNKGLTLDARSPENYEQLLGQLPLGRRMDPAQVRRARQYAYHFFFRRMVPVDCLVPAQGNPPFRLVLSALSELGTGHSRGLDILCDGILSGSDFIYPAEQFPVASTRGA